MIFYASSTLTLSLILYIWYLYMCYAAHYARQCIFSHFVSKFKFDFFDSLDRSTTWRLSWRIATCPRTSIAAHLVRTGRVQRSNGGRTTFASTRIRSKQSTHSYIPRRHVHQQHVRDAIQEGQLWSWRRHLSSGHQVSIASLSTKNKMSAFGGPFRMNLSKLALKLIYSQYLRPIVVRRWLFRNVNEVQHKTSADECVSISIVAADPRP